MRLKSSNGKKNLFCKKINPTKSLLFRNNIYSVTSSV